MNQEAIKYEKLAALLIRIICLLGFMFGVIGFSYAILSRLALKEYSVQAAETFYVSIFYFVFSLILFGLSRTIAGLLCKGL